MIFFYPDMSKNTNTVVYFDWKMVVYIYVCGKCHTQFMLPMEKSSHIHRRIFVYKAKEGRHVRIGNKSGFLSFLIAEKHVSYIYNSFVIHHNTVYARCTSFMPWFSSYFGKRWSWTTALKSAYKGQQLSISGK